MIELMCTLFVVFRAAPVYGNHGSLAPPVNPEVSLRHLRYVVHWEAAPGSPAGVHYSVEMLTLSHSGLPSVSVPGCESVFSLECDVTESFSKIDETYYTRMTAHLGDSASKPASHSGFMPKMDAKAEPPLMSLSLCNQSLCINLKPPADWLTELYESYKYKLNISTQGRRKHLALVDTDLQGYVLKDVVPGREYCVSVAISISGSSHTHTHSTPQCVTTPTLFNTEALVSVLVCVCVVVVVASVPLMVYSGYICLRTTLPSILVSLFSPHLPLLLRAVDPVLSLVTVVTTQTKGRLEEEESEEEEEEGSEGRVGYERRVQAGTSSSSSSSSSSSPRPSSPPGTPPLPPETEQYRCGRGLELAPPLVESGSAGHRDTHGERGGERGGDMEDGGIEEEEDGGGESVGILSVTQGEKDGGIEEEEDGEREDVSLFSVTRGEKDGGIEEEGGGEDVNLFSVTLGVMKMREEEECELTDAWAPLLTHTHTPAHQTTHTHTPVHQTTHTHTPAHQTTHTHTHTPAHETTHTHTPAHQTTHTHTPAHQTTHTHTHTPAHETTHTHTPAHQTTHTHTPAHQTTHSSSEEEEEEEETTGYMRRC